MCVASRAVRVSRAGLDSEPRRRRGFPLIDKLSGGFSTVREIPAGVLALPQPIIPHPLPPRLPRRLYGGHLQPLEATSITTFGGGGVLAHQCILEVRDARPY